MALRLHLRPERNQGSAVDVNVEDARSGYHAAYEAYRVCAARVAEATKSGDPPSDEDLKAEERALADLSAARARLMEAIVKQAGLPNS